MDQIASLEKLRKHLKAIRASDNYIEIQNLITELHFVHESFRITKTTPALNDQRTLLDCAYYLFTALTIPQRQKQLPSSYIQDGLSIAGLVFELLGRYAGAVKDIDFQRECYLNAAIADSLSRYEANAAVLAASFFNENLSTHVQQGFLANASAIGMNLVFALLARKFFWIQHNGRALTNALDTPDAIPALINDPNSGFTSTNAFWALMSHAIADCSDFMIAGDENFYERSDSTIKIARRIARDSELLFEHWVASRLNDCFTKMTERSCWRVLRNQGFSSTYISTLTRFPWNAVHELWSSQLDALTNMDSPGQPAETNYLDEHAKRIVISMPTSAGKTLVAEMAIVKTLESKPGRKCLYIAPTRALVDEIETKLHRRLRFLGYRVASVVGAFEISALEQDYLEKVDVAVLTPEKLDYLLRKRDAFISNVSLIVFDESHKVSDGDRGWFLETLITWLMLKPSFADVKMIFMSAVLPHSQQPLIRQWIGQDHSAPLVSTDWSPTRQMIAVLWYSAPAPDWRNPVEIDEQGNRCYFGGKANLTFRYDIGDSHRNLMGIYSTSKFWVREIEGHFRRVNKEVETRYERCINLIKHLDANSSILVYFHEKVDIIRFCTRITGAGFERIADQRLDKLIKYISARLGDKFPMLDSLPFGIGFHYGDLPPDVRNEIENAYRDKTIRVLACTTTLAEGVNLPVETFILGYHQSSTGYKLSVRDFKNIIGRAGRALVETEGKIIAIRHPEFSRSDTALGQENSDYFDALISLDSAAQNLESAIQSQKNKEDIDQITNDLDNLVLQRDFHYYETFA